MIDSTKVDGGDFERVLFHEFGHAFDFSNGMLSEKKKFRSAFYQAYREQPEQMSILFGYMADDPNLAANLKGTFSRWWTDVTDGYAGQVFAESFAQYYADNGSRRAKLPPALQKYWAETEKEFRSKESNCRP